MLPLKRIIFKKKFEDFGVKDKAWLPLNVSYPEKKRALKPFVLKVLMF